MIQITQIKMPYGHSMAELEHKIKKLLKLSKDQKIQYKILKSSIDGRKKPEIYSVYSVGVFLENERTVVGKIKNPSITLAKKRTYCMPTCGDKPLLHAPLIIGAGPAGLFAAYLLAETGFSPILIERGKPVEQRTEDVKAFWETGVLNPSSNVQFGEGGAGTFSDGKLNTVVKDPANRNLFVLETFIKFGAPEQILYENKPHIGTDILCKVIANMRNYIIKKGATVYFETCAQDFRIENGKITEVICKDAKNKTVVFQTDAVVLAPGHSARDTFQRLYDLHIPMEAKNFAVGFRVEHPQEMINKALYGEQTISMPAAPYKVTSNFPNGRGVYSFCMCPGGYVVNASSEEGMLVVNGMSYSGRDSSTANSAIIVSVTTDDFGSTDPLAGMHYQRKIEQKAFSLASGKIPQQLYGDFCSNQTSTGYGQFTSNTKGNVAFANMRGLFSEEIENSFIDGMSHFANIIPDFNRADAILSGIESRTSSPLRILRDENYESTTTGLYPCGEGAGYAGGITSAAMDGLRVAEAIIQKYKPN